MPVGIKSLFKASGGGGFVCSGMGDTFLSCIFNKENNCCGSTNHSVKYRIIAVINSDLPCPLYYIKY